MALVKKAPRNLKARRLLRGLCLAGIGIFMVGFRR
jgi:hypothetical protein